MLTKQKVYIPVESESDLLKQGYPSRFLIASREANFNGKMPEYRQSEKAVYLRETEGYFFTKEELGNSILDYLVFRQQFKEEELASVRKEQERVGGIFSWIPASDKRILQRYLESI